MKKVAFVPDSKLDQPDSKLDQPALAVLTQDWVKQVTYFKMRKP